VGRGLVDSGGDTTTGIRGGCPVGIDDRVRVGDEEASLGDGVVVEPVEESRAVGAAFRRPNVGHGGVGVDGRSPRAGGVARWSRHRGSTPLIGGDLVVVNPVR
jgi:hypothetical protein